MIDFVTLLSVTIPSTLVGVLMIGIFSWFRGKDLDKDDDFQTLIADPESRKYVYGEIDHAARPEALRAASGPRCGSSSAPSWSWRCSARSSRSGRWSAASRCRWCSTIQMFMLMAGALIVVFTKTNPAAIGKNEVFRAGMIAVVAVFGVAWMADTVFEANLPVIKDAWRTS